MSVKPALIALRVDGRSLPRARRGLADDDGRPALSAGARPPHARSLRGAAGDRVLRHLPRRRARLRGDAGPREPALDDALGLGALLGLVAYATYDLTNQATLRDWPWRVTLADLCWGTFVTARCRGGRLSDHGVADRLASTAVTRAPSRSRRSRPRGRRAVATSRPARRGPGRSARRRRRGPRPTRGRCTRRPASTTGWWWMLSSASSKSPASKRSRPSWNAPYRTCVSSMPSWVCAGRLLPAAMRSRNTFAARSSASVTRLQRMPGPSQRHGVAVLPRRLRGQAMPAGRLARKRISARDRRRLTHARSARAGAGSRPSRRRRIGLRRRPHRRIDPRQRARQRLGREHRRLGDLEQRAADGVELAQARAAMRAAFGMGGGDDVGAARQAVGGERHQQGVVGVVANHGSVASIRRRRLIMASRMRDLTVPSGRRSSRAISACGVSAK